MVVQTAFLNGVLSEEVYVKQAPGFEKLDSSSGLPYIWKLRKSLYGLRQSPSVWNVTTDQDLRNKGFKPTASDPCVYTKSSGNTYVMLTFFIDDILLTGPSAAFLQDVRRDLQQSLAMTDMGEIEQIRIDINQDLAAEPSPSASYPHSLSVLKRFKMDNANPVHNPGTPTDPRHRKTAPCSPTPPSVTTRALSDRSSSSSTALGRIFPLLVCKLQGTGRAQEKPILLNSSVFFGT